MSAQTETAVDLLVKRQKAKERLEVERLKALNAELLEALERVVSRIDQAVDHKIHTGRMEPIGALLSEIQDGARLSIESAKARN